MLREGGRDGAATDAMQVVRDGGECGGGFAKHARDPGVSLGSAHRSAHVEGVVVVGVGDVKFVGVDAYDWAWSSVLGKLMLQDLTKGGEGTDHIACVVPRSRMCIYRA